MRQLHSAVRYSIDRGLWNQAREKSIIILLTCVLTFSGLVACHEDKKDVFQLTVAQASEHNPRNSESDIISLKDKQLLLGWTEFYGKSGNDDGTARIVGRVSADQGRTWGEKYTLVENDGKRNVMEVNFLRLKSGEIALFYLKKNAEVAASWNTSSSTTGDCRVMMRVSKDEGKTFGQPKELTGGNRYVETASGRSLMLKNGRILIECDNLSSTFCLISDDDGVTWHEGQSIKPTGGECWEPAAVELKDGRVRPAGECRGGHIGRGRPHSRPGRLDAHQ